MPLLNMGFKGRNAEESKLTSFDQSTAKMNEEKAGPIGLNLAKLGQQNLGFQDEFMENYENFSESWRAQIDAERRF